MSGLISEKVKMTCFRETIEKTNALDTHARQCANTHSSISLMTTSCKTYHTRVMGLLGHRELELLYFLTWAE